MAMPGRTSKAIQKMVSTLETTQRRIHGFFSQLPYKCYLPEAVSVEDGLMSCPWVASRVVSSSVLLSSLEWSDPEVYES